MNAETETETERTTTQSSSSSTHHTKQRPDSQKQKLQRSSSRVDRELIGQIRKTGLGQTGLGQILAKTFDGDAAKEEEAGLKIRLCDLTGCGCGGNT